MKIDRIVPASDGVPIATTFFNPQTESKGSVIIAAAMGVPQKFYADFARWLSTQGFLAVTFDYRGMGRSAPPSLKYYQADIRDWAELDCAAVLNKVKQENGDKPLIWIGHSLGGQIIGLIPNCDLITKAITVASGNGYWRGTKKFQKLASLWLWYGIVPITLMFCSYFPGRKMRIVGDLPSGVIQQWRQWCLSKRYLLDNVEQAVRDRYESVQFPITFYAIADDEMLSYRAIKSVHGFYQNAPRELQLLHPEELEIQRIGHFGFFREQFADKLWRKFIAPQLLI